MNLRVHLLDKCSQLVKSYGVSRDKHQLLNLLSFGLKQYQLFHISTQMWRRSHLIPHHINSLLTVWVNCHYNMHIKSRQFSKKMRLDCVMRITCIFNLHSTVFYWKQRLKWINISHTCTCIDTFNWISHRVYVCKYSHQINKHGILLKHCQIEIFLNKGAESF